mmetsp:Transcript_11071/g.26248  ORF Transcript_11071/g.26248 Transcript_11071/m.26248 type:complete len:107 (-) Transcript_11071:2853-3173(-)
MVLLSNDGFLNELHKLFERTKDKGSIFVTMKRSALKPKTKRYANPPEEAYCCLIRVSDGKKRKFSTTLREGDAPKFLPSLHTILRAHMDSLKKREKTGKKSKPAKK